MQATALISQSALNHNLAIVHDFAPTAKIVAMVKANAYGHHLECVQPLIDNADLLAVSELAEAVKLREKTKQPILLLSGVYSEKQLQHAIKLNCTVVVHQPEQVSLINQTQCKIKIWLKIDTGMHRLGLSSQEYADCRSSFQDNSRVKIECVMSHFSCADVPNHPMNAKQLDDFKALTDTTHPRSMANSAALLSQPESVFDWVRPGIMLYGVSPFKNSTIQLKPVMQLSAPILSIKTVKTGGCVGYGATWQAKTDTVIAIIGIGYGDGYPRHAQNGTPVLIKNTLCKLVGRVSMDLICVDITDLNAAIGDKAILWGHDKLRVETVASYSDTIGYELLTGVNHRVKFECSA